MNQCESATTRSCVAVRFTRLNVLRKGLPHDLPFNDKMLCLLLVIGTCHPQGETGKASEGFLGPAPWGQDRVSGK